MFKVIVNQAFGIFDREALNEEENAVLDEGIEKHRSVLMMVLLFALPQLVLALIALDVMMLMTGVSFISLLLGGAWYAISFQNVSAAQLAAGVADFITRRMFRGFMISFSMLTLCLIAFLAKLLLPELEAIPPIPKWHLFWRLLVLLLNAMWVMLVFMDVYFASVAYDAADSLLGDGFPTLMRGARAQHKNSPMIRMLAAMALKQGVEAAEVKKILGDDNE